MPDLFPETLSPCAIGLAGARLVAPVFFCIYPEVEAIPAILETRRHFVRQLAISSFSPRPTELLHVSIAACGRPVRLRQPLQDALKETARKFSFASFTMTFHRLARFGRNGSALVIVADEETRRMVHRLRRALADVQQAYGLKAERTPSDPHVTLGYSAHLPDVSIAIPPLSFRAQVVELVVSNQGYSEHLVLARWPLVGDAG
ncbi:2'-5' RNA ligase family protein [Pseudoxanthomonas beigongshangi]